MIFVSTTAWFAGPRRCGGTGTDGLSARVPTPQWLSTRSHLQRPSLFRITTNVALDWHRDTRHKAARSAIGRVQPSKPPRCDCLPIRIRRSRSNGLNEHRARKIGLAIAGAATQTAGRGSDAQVRVHRLRPDARTCRAAGFFPALNGGDIRAYETLRRGLADFLMQRAALVRWHRFDSSCPPCFYCSFAPSSAEPAERLHTGELTAAYGITSNMTPSRPSSTEAIN